VEGGSRSTIVIWLVAAGLAAIAAFRLVGSDSAAPPVRIDGPATPGRASTTTSSHAGNEEALYVHVAGAVRRPGLIRVPSGTRVATALERAGGPTRRADLTLVNLAAPLQDGQQIVVPLAASGAAAGGAGTVPGAKIHLSTATADQLDEVDGIGPTLAERIVEYRDEHGGFRSLEDLAQVEGIGEKRLKTLRDALQP
jgi:competence protein ComEA